LWPEASKNDGEDFTAVAGPPAAVPRESVDGVRKPVATSQ
jgi:hypothetical protein